MKLDKSINNLAERIASLDNGNGGGGNGHDIQYWKGRKLISLNEWAKIADMTKYAGHGSDHLKIEEALQYFPAAGSDGEYFNEYLFVFGVPEAYEDKANKWYRDYKELHEHIMISKYGLETYKKMIEEEDYQRIKKAWYFHESSWYMRDVNWYDGYGCDGSGCIPECPYFKPSLYDDNDSSPSSTDRCLLGGRTVFHAKYVWL